MGISDWSSDVCSSDLNPVCLGKSRAKQTQFCDTERGQVMTVLLHGDAAFAGQGVVAECFALSELRGYRTGGTIHIIVNNQIDRKSTRLNSVTNAHLVCRLLLEKKKKKTKTDNDKTNSTSKYNTI